MITLECDIKHEIFDCTITDSKLSKLIGLFVPDRDVYYFDDDEIVRTLLSEGITVYTREEFSASFPTFALDYGSLYSIWTLKIPDQSYVTLVSADQLDKLSPEVRRKLLTQQIEFGRGHVYDIDWFNEFEHPAHTITVDGEWRYLLTSEDWWGFAAETRKRWVLKWLRECRKEEPTGTVEFARNHDGIPYDLIDEYAGTFADKSGPNCFAAAIAMVVGGGTKQNQEYSRMLISQWLHEGPFFRLLKEQGYSKNSEWHQISNLASVQPTDILIWHKSDGVAGHAAFAVSNESIFQKQAQGWETPWQVLRSKDIWYNEYLKTGGYIAVYRNK